MTVGGENQQQQAAVSLSLQYAPEQQHVSVVLSPVAAVAAVAAPVCTRAAKRKAEEQPLCSLDDAHSKEVPLLPAVQALPTNNHAPVVHEHTNAPEVQRIQEGEAPVVLATDPCPESTTSLPAVQTEAVPQQKGSVDPRRLLPGRLRAFEKIVQAVPLLGSARSEEESTQPSRHPRSHMLPQQKMDRRQ